MHAPLDLYAIQWKLVLGVGAMHFVTWLFALAKALPARGKSSKPGEKYDGRTCLLHDVTNHQAIH